MTWSWERGAHLRSKVIAAADRGRFSHALLWLGGTDFIEAVGTGVRVISFRRVIVKKPKKWLLLRLTDDPATAERAAAIARNMAHKQYDLRGALSTKVGGRRIADPTRLFCSHLVAAAYAEAGRTIVEGKTPQQVTPAALERRSVLKSIPLPLIEIGQASDDRDAGYEGSPMDREMRASQAAFLAVQDRISALKDPKVAGVKFPPGGLYELLEVLARQEQSASTELEDKLLSALEASNYFHLIRGPLTHSRLELERTRAEIRSTNLANSRAQEISKELRFITTSFRETQMRFRHNGSNFQKIYADRRHKLWLRLASMHLLNADGMEMLIQTANEVESELEHRQNRSH